MAYTHRAAVPPESSRSSESPEVPGTPGTSETSGSPRAAAAAARRDAAVRAAVARGLLSDEHPVAALLDVASVRETAAALHAAFDEVTAPGQPVLHSFAVKASSLVPVLRLLDDCGLGCEVASPGELALARAAGVGPERIVLDSPAKTAGELREALELGIALNADNRQELERLDALMAPGALPSLPGGRSASPVGLRVNPQLGGGSIGAMSTATATSKFGFALQDEGAREFVVRACAERPWITRLHCHVGSQGMPLEKMAAGVAATYELAEEVNRAAGERRIDTLDIGGGLPVNFGSEEVSPTFAEYARLLRDTVPGLFDGRYGLVTEFGRSVLAKCGLVLARVEYAKSSGGRPIAVTHAGAQVAVRTVFAPEAWPLRVAAYDGLGRPKRGAPVVQDIAGPCCFAGDLVARGRELPELASGDLVALLDTGAYYFSTPFDYNSLPRPGVYGFTLGDAASAAADGSDGGSGGGVSGGQGVCFATVRPPQTLDELVAASGGAQRDALTAPRP
ncbi:diaminopimelate decarboxylase [Streptomyces nanhaiensis]|uniref:diaminopimelate decarboxylase n=1 Tax=Streptomyces nanhaiensis TaxID=679319 RepID=UPI00399C77D3